MLCIVTTEVLRRHLKPNSTHNENGNVAQAHHYIEILLALKLRRDTIDAPPLPRDTIDVPPLRRNSIDAPPLRRNTIEAPPLRRDTIDAPPLRLDVSGTHITCVTIIKMVLMPIGNAESPLAMPPVHAMMQGSHW